MATAIIREYADIKVLWAGRSVMAPSEPAIATQIITTSATTAPSAAFNTNTQFVGIHTPAAQAVAVEFSATAGATPTAVANGTPRLPSNSVFYFGVKSGDKVALVDVT